MTKIPMPEEVGNGTYFLQVINNATAHTCIRILLLAIAIGFIASYIYIRVKKDKE